jgi:thiosulfate/3-mercaptopyruvate sulfurtransferase
VAVAAELVRPPVATPPGLVVSVNWLAENRTHPNIVVLHVGNEVSYQAGHIPGARFFALATFAPEREGLSTEIPEAAALADALESEGISSDSRIVVYSTAPQPQLAARLYITLDHFGMGSNVSLLDGGLVAWRAEERPLSMEAEAPAVRGAVQLTARSDVLADYTYVQAHLGDPSVAIVDARDTRFWSGEERNQQRAARAGRVPGAKNVVYSSLVDEQGRLLAADQLAARFAEAGVQPGQPVVTYCHVGQQASLVFLAARLLGHEARLYDGSYEDWSRRPELPVEPSQP